MKKNCLINNVIINGKKKRIDVILRYIRIKYKISLDRRALEKRMKIILE